MEAPKIANPNSDVDKNFDEVILDIKSEEKKENVPKKKGVSNLLDLFNTLNDWVIDKSPVQLQDKLLFFQLLGATIQAGISVPESLRILEGQTKNEKLKRSIRDIWLLIEDGEGLAGAMRRNSDIFDEATCSIVEAGEKSGKLNEVLKELVTQYERLSQVQKKVKSVMMYPIIVMTVMVLLSIVVIVFVVPKLIDLFGEIGNLPLPTRILIGASDLVLDKWLPMTIVLTIFSFVFVLWKKSRMGQRQWAYFLLSFPVVGMILKGMILSKVTRIFGFLIASGVPVIEGLKIAANTSSNPLYEERLLLASDDLSKGISIAENLSDHEKMFPTMLVNMIDIGEKTASLEGIMSKIADFYEEELDRKVENLSKIMEPFILALIAGGAVFMILAIYLPILKMSDKIMG